MIIGKIHNYTYLTFDIISVMYLTFDVSDDITVFMVTAVHFSHCDTDMTKWDHYSARLQ